MEQGFLFQVVSCCIMLTSYFCVPERVPELQSNSKLIQNHNTMRILQLHCKNINSLEGETRLDFTQAPFVNSGVFAITGANGSGKSSILDAITLGLYGETARSQARVESVAEQVMTQHTHECVAVVDFGLQGQRYRSTWSAQRTTEGGLSTQMQLTCLNDSNVLATNAAQVTARITELTGMNFRNFTRAMLLVQGDFAAFLHALDNERLDILEKIVGADSYEQYKNEVLHQAEQAEQALNQLRTALQVINLVAPEQSAAYALDLADINQQISELQKEQQQFRQQHDALKNITGLQSQVKQQEQKLKLAETLAKTTQEQLHHLLDNEDALAFEADLTAVQTQAAALQHSQTTLSVLQTELQHMQTKLSHAVVVAVDTTTHTISSQQQAIIAARIELSTVTANRQAENSLWQSLAIQLSEKKSALSLSKTWLEEHAADAALLTLFPDTSKIKQLRTELSSLHKQQHAFTPWAKTSRAALKKNRDALETAIKKATALSQQQQRDEQELNTLLQGNTIEQLDSLQLEQYQRMQDFQELLYLAQAHEKLMAGGFKFFWRDKASEPQALPDSKQLMADLEQLHLDIRREENIKRVLETAIVREALVKKLAVHRAQLVEDEPCYLCGSVQHPYSSQPPIATNSQQALVDQQAKIRTLVATANSLRVRIKETEQQSLSKQSKHQKAQQVSSQWLILCNRLNASSRELKIYNIGLMKQLLARESEELKNINKLLDSCQRKQSAIDKAKAALVKKNSVIKQLQDTVHQLETAWQQRNQEQQDSMALLATLQQEEQQAQQHLAKQLQQLGETMPEAGQEDALLARLNARRGDYQSHSTRLSSLNEAIQLLHDKQAACQTEMTMYDSQFAELNARVQREESIGLQLAFIEKQKLIAEKDAIVRQQRRLLTALEQLLHEKLANTRFANVNALQETLKRLEQLPLLQQRGAEQQADLIKKTNTLTSLQEQLAPMQRDSQLEGLHFDSINEQLRRVNEQLDIAKLESKRLSQWLQTAEQVQQQYDNLSKQLQQQQLITQPLLDEVAQLSVENGINLRRRLQQRMIEQLLAQTNGVLEKISGRYYLRQRFSEQGLALMIEDTYQGNVQRALKTLSGGESFVISLALALGLSELANNGKSVDSLFLDEGFGNLDAETLYTVISTLESLHLQGKTVGVISHVEAVQKRFKTQLHILKKPNGFSQLKMLS